MPQLPHILHALLRLHTHLLITCLPVDDWTTKHKIAILIEMRLIWIGSILVLLSFRLESSSNRVAIVQNRATFGGRRETGMPETQWNHRCLPTLRLSAQIMTQAKEATPPELKNFRIQNLTSIKTAISQLQEVLRVIIVMVGGW